MLAPLGFSCPRCLLLRRGAGLRSSLGSLARQLAGSSSRDTAGSSFKDTDGSSSKDTAGSKSRDTTGSKDTASSTGNKDMAANSNKSKRETITAKDNNSKDKKSIKDIELPPEPTTCCMSGCANCVWLDYAQTLAKLLGDNDEAARELVLSKITDPNLKMFLSLELRQMARQREEQAAAEKAAAGKPKTPPAK